MSLRLETVAFNHDTASANRDAFNIRHNFERPVRVPEWRRVAGNVVSDPAAYAVNEVGGNTVSVRVTLQTDDPALQRATVRAVGFSSLNALGNVIEREVIFPAANVPVTTLFDLDANIGGSSVGINDVGWRWDFRPEGSADFTHFATSSHKIYFTLDVPALGRPWRAEDPDGSNTQMPWAEVLDFACRWAQGARTLDEAAKHVTNRINELGGKTVTIGGQVEPMLKYSLADGGFSHYSKDSITPESRTGRFDCTAFLERLRGRAGNGGLVNCSDCATFVSTFAGALGCVLAQSQMGTLVQIAPEIRLSPFSLNKVIPIGFPDFIIPFAGSFNFHEVAWKGDCTEDNEVFDACLVVDGDPDPTVTTSHTRLLPANLLFGRPGDLHYRDRLASAADNGRPLCVPIRNPAFRCVF